MSLTPEEVRALTILQCTVGSVAHGTNLDGSSDQDDMGILVAPPEYVIGLRGFEQFEARSRPKGERSRPGDRDLVVYSLRKWASLALKGNPSALLPLFVPDALCSVLTPVGRELRALAPAFMSKQLYGPFRGYMVQQRGRLAGELGQMRVTRTELVAQYGYDTKYAYHMLRLGLQGIEVLLTGRISLPMTESARETLLDVRRGRWTIHQTLSYADYLDTVMAEALDRSPLPDGPDWEAVEAFLIATHLGMWRGDS